MIFFKQIRYQTITVVWFLLPVMFPTVSFPSLIVASYMCVSIPSVGLIASISSLHLWSIILQSVVFPTLSSPTPMIRIWRLLSEPFSNSLRNSKMSFSVTVAPRISVRLMIRWSNQCFFFFLKVNSDVRQNFEQMTTKELTLALYRSVQKRTVKQSNKRFNWQPW